MDLLFTLTTYPPTIGGAQIHHHLLAQQLRVRHGIQVVSHWDRQRTDWLLGTTLKAPRRSHNYVIDQIPVHRLGLSLGEKLQLLPAVLGYYPLMDWALPAIAHVLSPHLAPYAAAADLIHNVRIGREGLSYTSQQLARRYDIPWILTPVHHPRWVGWRYRCYLRLYREADGVIALTATERETLIQLGVRGDRIWVTGIGPVLAANADPHRFRQQYHLPDPATYPLILFLGQHYSYKGYRQLLDAAPLVWAKVPEAQFVFMGPAVGRSEQVFQTMTDPRIHRLGTVDLQTKTDGLAACTLLCVPSSQESFGGVYTEAWSFAKPVIGCQIPAVADVVTEGVDGYLVAQTAEAIADRLLHLLLNPSIAAAMGTAGQTKVRQQFTWERLAERTEAVYEQVRG